MDFYLKSVFKIIMTYLKKWEFKLILWQKKHKNEKIRTIFSTIEINCNKIIKTKFEKYLV